jgi:hypothetical protein
MNSIAGAARRAADQVRSGESRAAIAAATRARGASRKGGPRDAGTGSARFVVYRVPRDQLRIEMLSS